MDKTNMSERDHVHCPFDQQRVCQEQRSNEIQFDLTKSVNRQRCDERSVHVP